MSSSITEESVMDEPTVWPQGAKAIWVIPLLYCKSISPTCPWFTFKTEFMEMKKTAL